MIFGFLIILLMVRVATVNVNGLEQKIQKTVNMVQHNNIDILCFQEVHILSDQQRHVLENDLKGILYCNASEQWSGTAILVRKYSTNFKIEHLKITNYALINRITHIRIHTNKIIDIVSIYAPANREHRLPFYDHFQQYISQFKDRILIIAGDFNYVENVGDRTPKLTSTDNGIKKRFKPLELGLVDVYASFNTGLKDFTHKVARLDRIYVTDFMIGKINFVKHLSHIADHKPVCMDIDFKDIEPWGRYYWKLNNSILLDDYYQNDIKNILVEFWDQNLITKTIDRWEETKVRIKKVSLSFSKFRARQRGIEKKVCDDMKFRGFGPEVMQNIEKKEMELKNFKFQGNMVRSTNPYLYSIYEDGKEISRKEEIRKGQQRCIIQIQNGESLLTDKNKILDAVGDFYSNLYSSQEISDQLIDNYLSDFIPPKVTKDQSLELDTFISTSEIKNAINDMTNNKSPGEDGLTTEFYKKFSDLLTPILVDVYNNIFLQGKLPKTMRSSIVNLIFKKKGSPLLLKSWRPISLLNLDYKILTRILANRIRPVINDILNPYQSSGCKNRSIINNALNLQNILMYAEHKDIPVALVSLDNEKAFDRVERNFIYKTLLKYNFPTHVVRWFEIIYTDIHSKIMVNGAFTRDISVDRGVRQGCPLSMLLYVLSLEPLIYKINSNPLIRGISLPNINTQVKNVQHADDTTAIITTALSYKYLEQEHNKFGKISGSKTNQDKTEIFTTRFIEGLPLEFQKDRIKVFGFYFGKTAVETCFEECFGKMENTVKLWTCARLNIFKKVTVIQTFLVSQLQYILKIYPIDSNNLQKFNQLIFQFLWSSKAEKLKRDTMTRQTIHGGLSMPNLKFRSEANFIQLFLKISLCLNQPWAALYIYWFGFLLKDIYPDLSTNKYVHTIDIPKGMLHLKQLIVKYKPYKEIWKSNIKQIYNIILHKSSNKSTIEINYPNINWQIVWKSLQSFSNPLHKTIIFRYIYGIIPMGKYLMKYKIVNQLPDCTMCTHGKYTKEHIFIKCLAFAQERKEMQDKIRSLVPHYSFNNLAFCLFGVNPNITTNNAKLDTQITRTFHEYVLRVWMKLEKVRVM